MTSRIAGDRESQPSASERGRAVSASSRPASRAGFALGIDLGTQSVKAQLLSPDGGIAGEARSAYGFRCPRPGWAEQDPEDWWSAITDAVAELLTTHALRPGDVAAIAFASQVDGALLVDDRGAALHPAMIWLDRRAGQEAAWLLGRLSQDEFRARSGLNADSTHVAPKLVWLRNHRSAAFAGAVRFHVPGSWAVARLTGVDLMDHSNASSTLLYDVRERRWSDVLLEAAQLSADRLPAVADATVVAGSLTAEAAAHLGLTEQCVVAVGCGDEHAAALGVGVLAPGPICDIAGTAEPVAVAAATPVIDETGLVETHVHADPRSWLIENPGFASGASVQWFSESIAGREVGELTALASNVAPGAEGVTFIPALSGAMTPRWNDSARGVFHGLSMTTGIAQLARAIFEGCAFGLRDVVDRFAEMGLGDGEIRAAGGGARSDLLLQMKADVTGRVVRRGINPEATAAGAAMIAGVAAGTFANLDEAAEALAGVESRVFEPSPATAPAYDDAYRAYRDLYDALEPGFVRFASR